MKNSSIVFYAMFANMVIILILSCLLLQRVYDIHFIILSIFLGFIFLFISYTSLKNISKSVCDKEWRKLFKIFRKIRHDFQNNLQIIYGMVQLEKYDLVLKYIMKIKREDENISLICNLSEPKLICYLLELVFLLREKDIHITVKINCDETPDIPSEKYIKVKNYVSKLDDSEEKKDFVLELDDYDIRVYPNI